MWVSSVPFHVCFSVSTKYGGTPLHPLYHPLYGDSTVRHAYPTPVPGISNDWFAEHMLPEGAHNHTMDWTVMFLNRDKPGLDEDWPPQFDSGGNEPSTPATVREERRGEGRRGEELGRGCTMLVHVCVRR